MEFVGSSKSDYNEFAKQIQKVNKVIGEMCSWIPFKNFFFPQIAKIICASVKF